MKATTRDDQGVGETSTRISPPPLYANVLTLPLIPTILHSFCNLAIPAPSRANRIPLFPRCAGVMLLSHRYLLLASCIRRSVYLLRTRTGDLQYPPSHAPTVHTLVGIPALLLITTCGIVFYVLGCRLDCPPFNAHVGSWILLGCVVFGVCLLAVQGESEVATRKPS